jgi:hypothetical protein
MDKFFKFLFRLFNISGGYLCAALLGRNITLGVYDLSTYLVLILVLVAILLDTASLYLLEYCSNLIKKQNDLLEKMKGF